MDFSYIRSKLPFFKHNLSLSTTMSSSELLPKHEISLFRKFSTTKAISYFRGHKNLAKYASWPKLARNQSFLCPLLRNNVRTMPLNASTMLDSLVVNSPLLPAVLISKTPKGLRYWHCAAALITICFLRVERVPYSGKLHFIFRAPKLFNTLVVRHEINNLEKTYGNSILPPSHPKSIRALAIMREIAQAMHNGLDLQKDCTIRAFRPDKFDGAVLGSPMSVGKSRDLSKVRDSKIMKFGKRCSTRHLEGREWRVLLVDRHGDNACMCPDGTMIIYSKFPDSRSADEKLAFTIGHEFGHAIARHSDLRLFRAGLISLLSTLLSENSPEQCQQFLTWVSQFFNRRDELEADHIGMMLMASAGYNPQAAPRFHRKHGYKSDLQSTYPSSAERARSLENPKKMRAMAVYNEALSARLRISEGTSIKHVSEANA